MPALASSLAQLSGSEPKFRTRLKALNTSESMICCESLLCRGHTSPQALRSCEGTSEFLQWLAARARSKQACTTERSSRVHSKAVEQCDGRTCCIFGWYVAGTHFQSAFKRPHLLIILRSEETALPLAIAYIVQLDFARTHQICKRAFV